MLRTAHLAVLAIALVANATSDANALAAQTPSGAAPYDQSGSSGPTSAPPPGHGRDMTELHVVGQLGAGGEPCEGKICSANEYCAVLQSGRHECMGIGIAAGRPYWVDGAPATPRLRHAGASEAASEAAAAGSTWAPELATVNHTTPSLVCERRLLAEAWLAAGSAEYASVASFSTHALELLSVGAPPHLVEAALEAASDEVRHAKVSFGLANAYLIGDLMGSAVASTSTLTASPASLNLRHTPALAESRLAALALSTARDGCVSETIAAVEAATAAARAEEGYVKDVLRLIARDEARHAVFGWEVVAWATADDKESLNQVSLLIRKAVAEAETSSGGDGLVKSTTTALALEAHGVLANTTKRDLRLNAAHQVIMPALEVLLSGGAGGLAAAQLVSERLGRMGEESESLDMAR